MIWEALKDFSDIKIKVEDEIYDLHKLYLINIPYFRAYILGDYLKNEIIEEDVEIVKKVAFESIMTDIYYIYANVLQELNMEDTISDGINNEENITDALDKLKLLRYYGLNEMEENILNLLSSNLKYYYPSYDDLEELLDLSTNQLIGDTSDKLMQTLSGFLDNVIFQLESRFNKDTNSTNIGYYVNFIYNLSKIIHYPLLASLMLNTGFFNKMASILTLEDINKLLPKSLLHADFSESLATYTDLYSLNIVDKLRDIIPDQVANTEYSHILDNLSHYYYLSDDTYTQEKYIKDISNYINS